MSSSLKITQHLHFDDMIHAYLILEELAASACETTYSRMGAFVNEGI